MFVLDWGRDLDIFPDEGGLSFLFLSFFEES